MVERNLISGIFLVVFFLQILLSKFQFLTPWKGGGFGMFSSIDHLGSRGLSCLAIDQFGIQTPCLVRFSGRGEDGPLTSNKWRNLRSMPSREKLQKILDGFLNSEQFQYKTPLTSQYKKYLRETHHIETNSSDIEVKALQLKMWNLEFDPLSLKIWPKEMGLEVHYGSGFNP